MGYVAVSGGEAAIARAEQLVKYYRLKGGSTPLEVTQIRDQLRFVVDRVMAEGALYAPDLAALALKQAEGDLNEAALMIRAYRATQPRRYYSQLIDTNEMRMIRRISATFQEVPGGQILGPTRDYTQRLLDFSLMKEDTCSVNDFLNKLGLDLPEQEVPLQFPKIIELLRQEDLLDYPGDGGQPPVDITRESLAFPCPRSARLQSLARGETGSMMALAYSVSRGWGEIHPYIGELRVGYAPLYINHTVSQRTVYAGSVLVTEAEMITGYTESDKNGKPRFALGYGLCFGHNEIKAIAMGILDVSMRSQKSQKTPAEDEEFVLYHIDGIEASGFVAHWKLPHYVTFQSDLDRLRKSQEIKEDSANASLS
jgi:alpha-D-ribose 1-methylphosphonate 5-triphosphate synthase subunit PhnI